MEVFFMMIALFFVILLLPHIVFLFKRILLCIKLKMVCKRQGFTLIPTYFFWFLGNFNGGRCDFYVQTSEQVYSVKLCGAPKKTIIDFVDSTQYAKRSLRFHLASTFRYVVPRSKRKKAFDFSYHCPEELRSAQIIPIILMNPMPLNVTYAGKGIGNGDYIVEGYFYNRTGFLQLLKTKNESNEFSV